MTNDSRSILIVDDEIDTCQNLSDILSDLGYHVDFAVDGPSALELVRARPYDVALLDLKMPGMDGVTLYRQIRELRPDTVAIIVTAYATAETAQEALEAGAWQILSKPVDMAQLMPVIDEAVDQALILVVDDDQDLCRNLWDLLRERKFRVSVAHSEQEAAARLADRSYQVVLIDLKLNGHNGGHVFRLVRQANPEARTVLITGYREEMDQLVQQVTKEGADAVCYKPFDIPQLLQVVRKLTA